MRDEDQFAGQPEFWKDEPVDDRQDMRKLAVRWGLFFVLILAFMLFALWWAGAAVHFSASRVDQSTSAAYRVYGQVRNAATGAPVPFAQVADDPAGRPPLFHTMADSSGSYTLMTIAEPHILRISALGFKPAEARVGKAWYRWLPRGSEQLDVVLQPE